MTFFLGDAELDVGWGLLAPNWARPLSDEETLVVMGTLNLPMVARMLGEGVILTPEPAPPRGDVTLGAVDEENDGDNEGKADDTREEEVSWPPCSAALLTMSDPALGDGTGIAGVDRGDVGCGESEGSVGFGVSVDNGNGLLPSG